MNYAGLICGQDMNSCGLLECGVWDMEGELTNPHFCDSFQKNEYQRPSTQLHSLFPGVMPLVYSWDM